MPKFVWLVVLASRFPSLASPFLRHLQDCNNDDLPPFFCKTFAPASSRAHKNPTSSSLSTTSDCSSPTLTTSSSSTLLLTHKAHLSPPSEAACHEVAALLQLDLRSSRCSQVPMEREEEADVDTTERDGRSEPGARERWRVRGWSQRWSSKRKVGARWWKRNKGGRKENGGGEYDAPNFVHKVHHAPYLQGALQNAPIIKEQSENQ